MSETRRGTAACLFSYGQLESKDETEEVTLSAHQLEKSLAGSVRGSRSWGIDLLVVVGDVGRCVGRTESWSY